MARARADFGTVRKLPSGRFQARTFHHLTGEQRPAPHTFESAKAARAWLAEQQTDRMRGTAVDHRKARATMAELVQEHLDGATGLKPKTYAGYASLLASCVESDDGIGDVAVGDLTPAAVREWLARLSRRPLSPSRVRQAYRLVAMVCDVAVRDRRLGRNPCDGVTPPRLPEPRARFLERAEIDRLVAAIEPEVYRGLVLVLAYGGLRWGEAVALRVRDVDLKAGAVYVSRSLSEATDPATGKHGQTFETPKSGRSRTVPLPDVVLDALRERLDALPMNPNRLLWTSRAETPLRHGNWKRRVWDKAAVAAGLCDVDETGAKVPNVLPHDLRRSCASHLFAAGWTVPEVQAHLGHADPSVTLRIYTQVTQGRSETARERFNEYLSAPAQPKARRGKTR